jgi:endonuclease III
MCPMGAGADAVRDWPTAAGDCCRVIAVTRLETLIGSLHRFYGALPLPPRDPFTLFVYEVLAVHSTPRKRDAALAALKRIPALTPDSMFRAPQKKLEESVKLAGPYSENRLTALRSGADLFRRTPRLPAVIRGPLPAARRAIKPLPQLGETGAHRMLLFAADHRILPVDARVSRVGRRLGYGEADPEFKKQARSVQEAMTRELPPSVEAFRRAFVYLSHHGAATCTEADPHCSVCPLLEDCPEGRKRAGTGDWGLGTRGLGDSGTGD